MSLPPPPPPPSFDEKLYIEYIEHHLREQIKSQVSLSKALEYLQENGTLDDSMKSILSTVKDSIESKFGEDTIKNILSILFNAKKKIREKSIILAHNKILQNYYIKDFEDIQTFLKKHSYTKHKKTINFGFRTCEDCEKPLDLQFRANPICHFFRNLKPIEKCICNSRLPLKKCSECFFGAVSKNLDQENILVKNIWNQTPCLIQCLQCGKKICIFEVICVFPEASNEEDSLVEQQHQQQQKVKNTQEKRKNKDNFSPTKKQKMEPRRCSKCKQPGHLVTTCGENNPFLKNDVVLHEEQESHVKKELETVKKEENNVEFNGVTDFPTKEGLDELDEKDLVKGEVKGEVKGDPDEKLEGIINFLME